MSDGDQTCRASVELWAFNGLWLCRRKTRPVVGDTKCYGNTVCHRLQAIGWVGVMGATHGISCWGLCIYFVFGCMRVCLWEKMEICLKLSQEMRSKIILACIEHCCSWSAALMFDFNMLFPLGLLSILILLLWLVDSCRDQSATECINS